MDADAGELRRPLPVHGDAGGRGRTRPAEILSPARRAGARPRPREGNLPPAARTRPRNLVQGGGRPMSAGPPTFKQRCKSHPPQIGCWLNTASPIVAELIASSGYDCVLIDREHSPADMMTALAMLYAARTAGCAVLLRVPANDAAEIKRAADIGVDGIMVPQVESAADAERAARSAYYPPAGSRGAAPGVIRASGFGRNASYMVQAAERMLLICQIESARGADAVEEIDRAPGVDLLFVGPYDFSAELGHPGEPDHPAVRRSIERIEQTCR